MKLMNARELLSSVPANRTRAKVTEAVKTKFWVVLAQLESAYLTHP